MTGVTVRICQVIEGETAQLGASHMSTLTTKSLCVTKRAKWQYIILYSMYVHYLHITTLYIHSYTYPPTLSSLLWNSDERI